MATPQVDISSLVVTATGAVHPVVDISSIKVTATAPAATAGIQRYRLIDGAWSLVTRKRLISGSWS